jgi:hypothetical protein
LSIFVDDAREEDSFPREKGYPGKEAEIPIDPRPSEEFACHPGNRYW